MKALLLICSSLFFIKNIQGQIDHNCVLSDVTAEEWLTAFTNDEVNDYEDQEFKRFDAENIVGVTVTGTDFAKYVKAELVDNELIISPTEAFKEFEKNEENKKNPKLNFRLDFQCTKNTGRLSFIQPIKDHNTYDPYFTETVYTNQLPMPLPANFDLTCIMVNPIVACDIDVSNMELDFAIHPNEDFVISWNGSIDKKNKCHSATIKTKNQLRLTSTKLYELEVIDSGNPTRNNFAKFTVEVDEQTTLPPNPQFETAYYKAKYNAEDDKHFIVVEEPIGLNKGCSNVNLKLLEYTDNFKVSCESNVISVELTKNLLDEVLKTDPVILLPIEATLEHAEGPGRTVLVVYLPQQECEQPASTTISPTTITPTECPICPSEATTVQTCPSAPTETPITCPTVSTTPGECDCPSTPSEGPTNYPSSESTTVWPSNPTECPITCPTPETTTLCPECPLTSTVTTEYPSDPTDCPSTCPTPEVTTECPTIGPPLTTCPPCPTTPEPPTEPSIKFNKDRYWFEERPWYVGHIGKIVATADPQEDIEYSVDPGAANVACDKNTGVLQITSPMKTGPYLIIAKATGAKSRTEDFVDVVINIKDSDQLQVKSSILVKHLDENEEAVFSLPCQQSTRCVYEIVQTYPEIELFNIDSDNRLHVKELNRYLTEEISKMTVPQFYLKLLLTESIQIDTKSENSSQLISNHNLLYNDEVPVEFVLMPVEVPSKQDQLIVSVIIDDVNDNYPVFDIGDELVVGYPSEELAGELASPYLAKVTATDKDLLENADIRYSTKSSQFVIHPKTGVIYPGKKAISEDVDFIVTATDKDGADDGLSTNLKVKLKLLKEENLIVLTVNNLLLEEIDDTMQKLSETSKMTIKYLTAAVIPVDQTDDSLSRQFTTFFKSLVTPRAVVDHSSRIVVYGLDKDDKPVKTDNLEEALEESGVLEDFHVDKWEPGSFSGKHEDDSTAGFIAAIAVLTSLLVIFIVATGAFYYFKIYKNKTVEPYKTMKEEEEEEVNREGKQSISYEKNPRISTISYNHEDVPQRRATGFVFRPPPVEEDEDIFGENKVGYEDVTNYNAPVWGENKNDLQDNKLQFANTNYLDYNGDTNETNVDEEKEYSDEETEDGPTYFNADNRKAVTFKETVEKINILVDDKQDDENDDILDERL